MQRQGEEQDEGRRSNTGAKTDGSHERTSMSRTSGRQRSAISASGRASMMR